MNRSDIHELDHRETDGVEVSLLWTRNTNAVSVLVRDAKSGDDFELQVDPADARDALHHPYAYAARNGVAYGAGARVAVHA
jgi:hypothetical protein